MKRFLASFVALTLVMGLTSCSDNNDEYYVSVSGEGSITIDYDVPINLYRMVVISDTDLQSLYLMGGSGYVSGDGDFGGRGASVMITMPNSDDYTTLEAQSFDIGDDYSASYSTYVDFNDGVDSGDYISLESGTVIIRRSGQLYDLRLLGIDSEGENVIISYVGYIYRSFYDEDTDSDTDTDTDTDTESDTDTDTDTDTESDTTA